MAKKPNAINDKLWPADAVERRSVAELIPYARNARTHSEEQVAQLAASIQEWGWTVPVLVDERGGIIAGHGRIMAARKLGLLDVPVMAATGWSEARKRAYVIADNKLAMNAGWDKDKLNAELAELAEIGFNLATTGFSDDELSAILAGNAVDGDNAEGGEGGESGKPQAMMKFGRKKVPITAQDVTRLKDLLERYVEEFSLKNGFPGWLCGGKHA